jgi:hypothetical protein
MNQFKILKYRYIVHLELFITKFVKPDAAITLHINHCFFNYSRLQQRR